MQRIVQACAVRNGRLFGRPFCDSQKTGPPEAPIEGLCCGQGCNKCVWIQYGEDLIQYYGSKSRDQAIKEIEVQISDPNIRAFVISELRMMWKKAQ